MLKDTSIGTPWKNVISTWLKVADEQVIFALITDVLCRQSME